MGNQVKTWRALRPLKVGGAPRNYGEFVPEAKDFPALRSLISTERLEMVWEDEDVIKQEMESYKKRDEEKRETKKPVDVTEDSSDEDSKKKVVKKKAASPKKNLKKKTPKKSVKKTATKENGDARELAEENV